MKMGMLGIIVAALFDIMMPYFFYQGISVRKEGKWPFAVILITGVVYNAVSIFCLKNTAPPYVFLILTLIELLCISACFKCKWQFRIVTVVLYELVGSIAEALVIIFSTQLGLDKVLNEDVKIIICKLLLFIFIVIIRLLHNEQQLVPFRYLIYFLAVPALSIVVIFGYDGNSDNVYWSMFFSAILLLNLVVYHLMNLLAKSVKDQYREESLQEQIEMQKEKYEQLSLQFIKGNKLLHDVNKHFRQLQQYLDDNDIDTAQRYLQKTDLALVQVYGGIKTGNLVLDSLLSNAKTRMDELGGKIELNISIGNNKITMDDYDLVVILGNILDNALEAVAQQEDKDSRKIKVEITCKNKHFTILVRNSISPTKKIVEKNRWFHGLGRQNIEETVGRYSGYATFDKQKEVFETLIVIPIKPL